MRIVRAGTLRGDGGCKRGAATLRAGVGDNSRVGFNVPTVPTGIGGCPCRGVEVYAENPARSLSRPSPTLSPNVGRVRLPTPVLCMYQCHNKDSIT
jgi:hypothetical protein